MSSPNSQNFDTNDDGELVDDDGDRIYCDGCEAPAVVCVAVSEEQPHDEKRCYCHGCHEVYNVGVQHGRYHEAALHKTVPGRDSAQEKPT